MSGEKFYFGFEKLVKGKDKKNIVQVNSLRTSKNFVNIPFLSHALFAIEGQMASFSKFGKFILVKFKSRRIKEKKGRFNRFAGFIAKQKPLNRPNTTKPASCRQNFTARASSVYGLLLWEDAHRNVIASNFLE